MNILFFGDSITYGEYDGILGGWVDILKRHFHKVYSIHGSEEINIFNLGIGGETTEGLLKRLDVEIAARNSSDQSVIFFAYGANDLAILNGRHQVSSLDFRENLQFAFNTAKKYTDKIFSLNILPVSDKIDGIELNNGKVRRNADVREYNNILHEVSTEHAVSLIDVWSVFYPQKEFLLSKDRLHPNEYGYSKIAEHIKPVIRNLYDNAVKDLGETKTPDYNFSI